LISASGRTAWCGHSPISASGRTAWFGHSLISASGRDAWCRHSLKSASGGHRRKCKGGFRRRGRGQLSLSCPAGHRWHKHAAAPPAQRDLLMSCLLAPSGTQIGTTSRSATQRTKAGNLRWPNTSSSTCSSNSLPQEWAIL
jgi:hypothetical protein